MGILDVLFGRQGPTKPSDERIFAISTAEVTIQTTLHHIPTGKAGICFQGVASTPFQQIQGDLNQLMQVASKDAEVSAKPYEDGLGYKWILIESQNFQTLVVTIHMASQTLMEQGYGEQLLCSVFAFADAEHQPVYWIYNYKRGKFYPFLPRPDAHSRQRDNGEEMHLSVVMEKEMPVEQELERWYPLWDLPI